MFKKFMWAFLEKGGGALIQFISIIILSRFLSPEEYGVYGIMAIFISLAEMLIDSGLGGAIVQKKNINQNDINTLFVSNFVISIFLYLLIFFLAPLIETFYSIQDLKLYIRVLGLTILFYSFTIVHYSLLQKELRFSKSANITLSATIISSVISIIAAFYGKGVWALILQPLFMSITLSLVFLIFDKRKLKFEFSLNSFKILWNFGSKLLFANLLQTVYTNISTSVIPKISSVKVTGYYYQASRINNIINSILQSAIDKAAFPILSKEVFAEILLKKANDINRIIATIVFPLFPILSIFSVEVIEIVFGKQWMPAAPFLKIIIWGGWGLLMQSLYRNIFKSLGDTMTILKIDIIKTIVGMGILVVSFFYGVYVLVVGITISMYIGAILYMYFLKNKLNYSIKKQLKDLLYPIITSLIMYMATSIFHNNMNYNYLNILFILVALLLYVLLNIILRNPLLGEIINKFKANECSHNNS